MRPDAALMLDAAFRAAAERAPDAPALTFLDARLHATRYTRGALRARVDALAARLRALALDRRAPLGLLLRTQEAQTLHYLAALAAGLVPAVLTPPNRKLSHAYYLRTTRAVVERCGFSAVVTDLDDLDAEVTLLTPDALAPRRDGPPPVAAPLPADAALLQFSSGTTGIKRGVVLSHAAALRQIAAYGEALALGAHDVVLGWLPLYHDMGFFTGLNVPLAWGVHSVMLDPLDWVANPALYLRAVAEHGATLSWHPNFAYAFMADRVRDAHVAGVDLSSLRGLANCSEPVTHESQRRFAARFAAHGLRDDVFLGCYAMAETGFALTHRQGVALDPAGPADDAVRSLPLPLVSVGRPIAGVELRIVSETGAPRPERAIGEIEARTPFAFAGYHNNREATAAAFHGDWYRTGDLGYLADGELFVCGRRKDLLIVGGVNVFPQDLEELVGRCDGVHPGRVAAFAHFDPAQQTERVVVLAESDRAEEDRLAVVVAARQAILAALQIANFEVHLVPPGWLVKSSSGKMARAANREQWTAEREAAVLAAV